MRRFDAWKLCAHCVLVFNVMANAGCGALKNDRSELGSGGSGGSSADEDAAMPNPARTSVSLHLDKVDPADPIHGGSECTPGQHWVNVPYQRDRPMAEQSQQMSEAEALAVAVSGESGDRLNCRVAPRGTAFTVTADITGYAEFEGQKLRPTVARFEITAISPDQTDAIGRVTLQDDASRIEYTAEGCLFSTKGGALGVEAGRIWAKVQCDYVESRALAQACRLDTGFLLLENCSQ